MGQSVNLGKPADFGKTATWEKPANSGKTAKQEQPLRVIGIIAEYNPFHSGHRYQIEEAKKRTGADWCIVAMSGDFVQRGGPAVYSKYLRAEMALSCGADLVVELPSAFAVSSAEDFAACGVALLTGLGAVDVLCFGSEDGEIHRIQTAARILAEEGGDFSALLSRGLRSGLSWPQARNQALLEMAEKDRDFPLKPEEMGRLLGSPNNLLGIEYCKAILRQNSPLIPLTILRQGRGYHDKELEEGQASASAIRRILQKQEPPHDRGLSSHGKLAQEARPHIPRAIWSLYGQEPPVEANDLSEVLNFCLLSLKREGQDYTLYGDVSPEMARRLDNCLLQQTSWEGRIEQLKTRQYTYTRISRALLHIVLGLTAVKVQAYKAAGRAPYARILGFRRESRELLALVKQKTSSPLITKTADAPHILTGTALDMFTQDIYASHIRQALLSEKLGKPVRNEFNQPICIL